MIILLNTDKIYDFDIMKLGIYQRFIQLQLFSIQGSSEIISAFPAAFSNGLTLTLSDKQGGGAWQEKLSTATFAEICIVPHKQHLWCKQRVKATHCTLEGEKCKKSP